MAQKPLLILTGPTAVGKTDLSIELARDLGGEIISADSMQVYRYMDIGSAKITKEQMQNIPHHLIDVLEPDQDFNVFLFQEMAKEAMEGIYERGHIPIITGGTGFYIQSVLYDIDFSEEADSSLRRRLEDMARREGGQYLHGKLKLVDPESAEAIHPNNIKRLIRALEYYELNGSPISLHNKQEREKKAAYRFCYFVLTDERQRLYSRIEERVDEMLREGLVEEVAKLKSMGCRRNMVSMQGLGYKEILSYLDGECSLEDAVSLIKKNTRHFAKRQLTWFRRERDVIWIHKGEFAYQRERILAYMKECYERNCC